MRKGRNSAVRGQQDFFTGQQIKAQIVNRMPEGYFKKLLRKGWDPGYFVEAEPDDYVTLGERLIHEGHGMFNVGSNGFAGPTMPVYERRKCVVLSKGFSDTNRRIVAQSTDGWIVGLWVAMLRRQLKTGTIDIKAWSFEVLTTLERDDAWWKQQAENWTQELLKKNTPSA